MARHPWQAWTIELALCFSCSGEAENSASASASATTGQALDCISEHPVVAESDLRGDQIFAPCAARAPEPGETPSEMEVACEASTVAAAERGCELAGTPCTGAIVVSKAAALCVAGQNGDLTAVDGPYAELIYHSGFQVPVWNIFTVTEVGPGSRRGNIFTVDATTGEFLRSALWEATS